MYVIRMRDLMFSGPILDSNIHTDVSFCLSTALLPISTCLLVYTMPKDDSGPSTNGAPSTNGEKQQLKRGDACLYCRKRRIKCSATKPSCQHCTKLKRECVYDNGKHVSRVKQLEEKVAELEGLLGTAPDPSSLSGNSSHPTPATSQRPDRLPTNGFQDMPIDVNMLDNYSIPSGGSGAGNTGNIFSNFGGSILGESHSGYQAPSVQHATYNPRSGPEELFDFSTLDPNFMSLVNSFGNTSTNGPPPPIEYLPPPTTTPENVFDSYVNGGPTSLTPFIDPSMGSSSPGPAPASSSITPPESIESLFTSSNPVTQNLKPSVSPNGVPYQAYVTDITDGSDPAHHTTITTEILDDGHARITQNTIGVSGDHPSPNQPYGQINGVGNLRSDAVPGKPFGGKKESELDGAGMSLVGGWFDAADLPRVARDHL